MPLSSTPYPVQFAPRDHVPVSLDALAKEMHVSLAFLRLCMDAGCPHEQGKMSVAGVLLWLFEHYPSLRALAGLKPLAPVPAMDPAVMAHLRMADAIVTLLDYGRTRASQWQQKRHLRRTAEAVARLADRAL